MAYKPIIYDPASGLRTLGAQEALEGSGYRRLTTSTANANAIDLVIQAIPASSTGFFSIAVSPVVKSGADLGKTGIYQIQALVGRAGTANIALKFHQSERVFSELNDAYAIGKVVTASNSFVLELKSAIAAQVDWQVFVQIEEIQGVV